MASGLQGSVVLVTFPDFDPADPTVGGAITEAGLELRMAPKLGTALDHRAGRRCSTVSSERSCPPIRSPPTCSVARPALRVIARTGVGYDTIDMAAATELGIQVVTTPGANENAVADHALGLLLALLRRIPELDADVRAGGWSRTGAHLPRQLAGSTVGVVGFGGIGRQVANRLAGFGVELLVHDPMLRPTARSSRHRSTSCSPAATS